MDVLKSIHLYKLLTVDGRMGDTMQIPGKLVPRFHTGPMLPYA